MTQIGDRNWNPFLALARAIPTASGNEAELKARQFHQAHFMQHQYGMELETHKAGLEEQAATAEHGRRMEFVSSILRHAQHETPIHINMGDYGAQFTKKAKQQRAAAKPVAQEKSSRLAYNDPETGRIKYREA